LTLESEEGGGDTRQKANSPRDAARDHGARQEVVPHLLQRQDAVDDHIGLDDDDDDDDDDDRKTHM
jgi:hypothetical protein